MPNRAGGKRSRGEKSRVTTLEHAKASGYFQHRNLVGLSHDSRAHFSRISIFPLPPRPSRFFPRGAKRSDPLLSRLACKLGDYVNITKANPSWRVARSARAAEANEERPREFGGITRQQQQQAATDSARQRQGRRGSRARRKKKKKKKSTEGGTAAAKKKKEGATPVSFSLATRLLRSTATAAALENARESSLSLSRSTLDDA